MSGSKTESGITLLESLLSIAVLILITSFAVPQLARTLAYIESLSTQQSLLTFIGSARAWALHRQQIVTLCPLSDDGVCTANWKQQLSAFEDINSNSIREPNEQLIFHWDKLGNRANLSWTLDRRQIRFRPNGSTTATTGSLRYCTFSEESLYSFRLVIARTGRTRVDRTDHGCGL